MPALAAPAAQAAPKNAAKTEIATLGGGCFWCVEAVYLEIRGVSKVESGYSGGDVADPSYEQVTGKKTGHAEVVQVTFDPGIVSYKDLLQIFFTVHDPTTRDRQGADVGPQYRSIVFYRTPEQQKVATEVIAQVEAEKLYKDPVVTELTPFKAFYRAEDRHQNYYARNPYQPYCMVVIAPKVAKFRKKWQARLKK
ncbi:MAG: peptide-methionine (S)-S-oxide reductase MsrA [Candidatus Sericytochromatia bacterium]|uniref:Peptide methionine sulfoxide reductase MsrA n=1 Tax=Candidatus Tanganyikabacteria bacterium TaxID=2961651 RepID=A0A937X5X6_9BACT|nr:peptide-methionine (S)-S-oxide reductase MsrA [Candidatus Tanganyikabacteria bacterium]